MCVCYAICCLFEKKNNNNSNGPVLFILMDSAAFCPLLKLGSLFVSPFPPEFYLKSETKRVPDLRLN